MENSSLGLRLKQALMGLVGLGVGAFFIVPPLLATEYSAQQGEFQATVLSSAAGVGVAVRPIVRARIEDETGRVFWVQVPPSSNVAPGTSLVIETWCETPAFENCTARYLRASAP